MNAETSDQALAGLEAIGAAVGVGEAGEDSSVVAGRVRDWLSGQADRCLVVFDNVADPDVVAPWLPAIGRTQVVISSNHRSVLALGVAVPVEVFTNAEALAFLAERTGRDDELGARGLADEMGHLPLALAQAAWVIGQEGVSYGDYLRRLRRVAVAEELRPVRGEGYPHGAAEAVLLSLARIGRGRAVRLERGLLDLLAVLSPGGVPRGWLHEAARLGLVGKVSGDVGRGVDAAIGRLAEPSLVTVSVDGSTVTMHRFVQRVVRDAARAKEDLGAILVSAGQLVEHGSVDSARISLDRPQMETFVQQSAALWLNVSHPASDSPQVVIDKALSLQNQAGQYLEAVGDLSRAIPLFEQTLTDFRRVLGEDHPETLASRNNLAYTYKLAGQLDKAVLLYEQTLTGFRRVLGEDHPSTLTSRSNLAGAYESAGQLDKAVPLYEQTLTDRRRVLGEDHPDTLTSRNNLAYTYMSAGQLDKAVPLYEQTLTDFRRVLGEDHPSTLGSRNNLAGAYESAGQLDKAVPLFEQTLTDFRRVLGEDHPDTLTSRNNLAGAYMSAGQLDKAVPLFEQTLTDFRRVLGEDHPDTLTSRNNLAGAYKSAGQLDKAVPLFEQTLTDRRRVLGEDHPDTLTSHSNLAYTYKSAGQLDKAVPLYEQTLTDRRRVLGEDHPDTLTSRNNLASAYKSAGQLDKAVPLYEQTLSDCLRVLGTDHPITTAVRGNLVKARDSVGQD
ncbi:tetratricopeptide repeat protein [Streptosporangium oxazolinicum]|uniref:tetratricopeptide repeat protein n=1 Tax=Streptosporangium oxazolinicum TaxID=909287 RepID=UPI0031E84E6B